MSYQQNYQFLPEAFHGIGENADSKRRPKLPNTQWYLFQPQTSLARFELKLHSIERHQTIGYVTANTTNTRIRTIIAFMKVTSQIFNGNLRLIAANDEQETAIRIVLIFESTSYSNCRFSAKVIVTAFRTSVHRLKNFQSINQYFVVLYC